MKTIALCALLLAFAVSLPAQQPGFTPPSLNATTATTSKRNSTTGTATSGQSQTIRQTAVAVAVSFLRPPAEPYDVQCFFVAKDEATRERYIFDASSYQAKGNSATKVITSQPLTGTSKTWTVIPFGGTFTGTARPDNPRLPNLKVDGTFSGASATSNKIEGSKIDGWVVRVVYQGQPIAVASSMQPLAEFAKANPEAFDKAIKPAAEKN